MTTAASFNRRFRARGSTAPEGNDIAELREWLGDYDPEAIDLDAINAELRL